MSYELNLMVRAREVQDFAGKQLYAPAALEFTDVEEWKNVQTHLSAALRELERMQGDTPEEEGELLLAILMGYFVTVRNPQQISHILGRSLWVLPKLTDPVLKCKLAAYCYLEVPDEELLELVRSLVEELKRSGRGSEVLQIEQMILD